MDVFLTFLDPPFLLLAGCVALLSGFVKGAVGFAMPLVMISGLTFFLPPDLALAGMILPVVISNVMQVMQSGVAEARDGMALHWPYVVVVCAMILLSAQFLEFIPPDALFLILGVPVVILCLVQFLGWRPKISPTRPRIFGAGAGVLVGALGGVTGVWGPPTVLYLLALDTPRKMQIALQGVIFGAGAVMLMFGHLYSGLLTGPVLWFSASLIAPALLGMWCGGRVSDRLDQERFRKATLLVLIVAGLNLIRRGLTG